MTFGHYLLWNGRWRWYGWAVLLVIELAAQVANEDGPHADVGVEQNLEILIPQEVDLALHIVHQAFHLIQVSAHLLVAVGCGRCGCGSRRGLLGEDGLDQ
jgi:hypothetical protein